MTPPPNPVRPWNEQLLNEELHRAGVTGPPPKLLLGTNSTNDDARELAAAGCPQWSIVAADHQLAGRGRLGRSWLAPAGTALLLSVVLRPSASLHRHLGWAPLVTGLGIHDAVVDLGVNAELKWPNDLVVTGEAAAYRKIAGVLAERVGDAVVVGVGMNVSMRQEQLPIQTATSLHVLGLDVAREVVLARMMAGWQRRWHQWSLANGDVVRSGIHADYSRHCLSIGRLVRIEVGDESVTGEATAVDADGHLVVQTAAGSRTISAGDVHYLK